MADVRVKGLADLNKFLQQLPAKMEQNVLRGALRAGANVIKDEAKRLVPVSAPNSRNKKRYGFRAGTLRDSIRVSARVKNGRVTASVYAGGQTKSGAEVYYASWVEFGTAAHAIVAKRADGKNIARRINRMTKRSGSLQIGGRFVGVSVMHPGSRPRPYLRPALDGKAQAAVLAAAEYIKKRLALKHGLNTSNVEIRIE
jgi:HK97 gp10 family phage protein